MPVSERRRQPLPPIVAAEATMMKVEVSAPNQLFVVLERGLPGQKPVNTLFMELDIDRALALSKLLNDCIQHALDLRDVMPEGPCRSIA